MKTYFIPLLVLALFLLGLGCSKKSTSSQDNLKIYVAIAPQAYLLEKIIYGSPLSEEKSESDRISIHVLISEGQNPHTFELSPQQMVDLSRSDVFFGIGIPLETPILQKLQSQNNKIQIVNTAEGILAFNEHHAHNNHEHNHGHEHDEKDHHVWLSPSNLRKIVHSIKKGLIELDPDNKTRYENNTTLFLEEIDQTDREIKEKLAPYKGEAFFVFHPAFGHFAEEYGLKQRAVEIEGKSPSPKQINHLIAEVKAAGAKTFFIQPQFDTKAVDAVVRAIDGKTVVLNPLKRNILNNLLDIANKLETAFQKQRTHGE